MLSLRTIKGRLKLEIRNTWSLAFVIIVTNMPISSGGCGLEFGGLFKVESGAGPGAAATKYNAMVLYAIAEG